MLEGVDELKAYHARMMTSDDPVVATYESDPQVDRRHVSDGTIVSQGRMNDVYGLTSGETLALDSRFTATLIRTDDGPAETGGFVIRSFHSSADAFDNPALRMVASRVMTYTALVAGGVALVVGLVVGFLLGRRRRAA